MKIGLIDLDNFTRKQPKFPNLPLMKISAWHKQKGDNVNWFEESKTYDIVYKAKIFKDSPEPELDIKASKIITGGTGYCLDVINGYETFDKSKNVNLPDNIEHIYPDYSLYPQLTDEIAYGFLTRGCPRGCKFCVVGQKEGLSSKKVANLSEFWNGQKRIELLDPNTFASKDWEEAIDQLIESKAMVNFNQGVDIRVMNKAKIEKLLKVRTRQIHFAWDNYEDKEIVVPKLKEFRDISGWNKNKVTVYILTNFNTTHEQDLERVEIIKDIGFQPYITRYNRKSLKYGHITNKLARYVNAKWIFWQCPSFEQYLEDMKVRKWA